MSRLPGRVSGLVPLAAALACTAATILWLLGYHGGDLFVGYVASPGAMLAAAAGAQRVGSQIVLPRPVRGFWKRISHGSVCLAVSGVVGAVATGAGGEPGISPWSAAPALIGIVMVILGFLHLPLGRRTALNWLQILLDGATVAVAGALIFFYVVIDYAVPGIPPGARAAAAVVGVGGLIAVVVIGRAAVAPAGPVDSLALRILTMAPLFGAAGSVLVLVGAEPARL